MRILILMDLVTPDQLLAFRWCIRKYSLPQNNYWRWEDSMCPSWRRRNLRFVLGERKWDDLKMDEILENDLISLRILYNVSLFGYWTPYFLCNMDEFINTFAVKKAHAAPLRHSSSIIVPPRSFEPKKRAICATSMPVSPRKLDVPYKAVK